MPAFLRRIERAWLRRNAPAQTGDADDRTPLTVITGATEGIGRALAMEFAAHGHNLLLVARSADGLAETAAILRQRHPAIRVETVAADLASPAGCDSVERALEQHRCIAEYLVNNAAVGFSGSFHEKPRAVALAVIDLNIRALTDLMARFLPQMIARGKGGILNVASFGGLVPGPYQSIYYASKAYVISLTEAVAQEVAGRGVRMSVLAPGAVATRFHARMGADSALYTRLPGMIGAKRVARVGYRNFMAWQTVIVPGVLPSLGGALVRFIPTYVVTPVVAFILKPRRKRTQTENDPA